MKRIMGFFLLLIVAVPGGYSQSSDRHLWDWAVQWANQTPWSPSGMSEKEMCFDKKGALVQTTYRKVQFLAESDGDVRAVLVRAEQDGKDITAKERRHFDGSHDGYAAGLTVENPFSRTLQSRIRLGMVREGQNYLGRDCSVIRFQIVDQGVLWTGDAWITTENGAPVKVEFGTEETWTEGKDVISGLQGTTFFNPDPEACHPVSICYIMSYSSTIFPLSLFEGELVHEVSFDNNRED